MPEPAAQTKTPLDELMLAMDVVDTLRHRARMVERELGTEDRERDLLKRLRDIYAKQGIEVPDHILKQGVEALEEDRFVYTPPPGGVSVGLARLYIKRGAIGKSLAVIVIAAGAAWGGYTFLVKLPAQREAEQSRVELSETVPKRLGALYRSITRITKDKEALRQAGTLQAAGLEAAKSGERGKALAAATALEDLKSQLNLVYDLRIVSRHGEPSGIWRIPKVNRNARNYYLIVEAIGRDGKPITLEILNEENSKRDKVAKWGVRVPKHVFDRVSRDKRDDGIIQNNGLAVKRRGKLAPDYLMAVLSGAITKW